jgi:hypothetical protein
LTLAESAKFLNQFIKPHKATISTALYEIASTSSFIAPAPAPAQAVAPRALQIQLDGLRDEVTLLDNRVEALEYGICRYTSD